MAGSVVEIYIQENRQENLHLEAAPRADLENDVLKIKALKMNPVTVILQGFCQDPE